MSKIKTRHVFTSESVSEGHPDKVCDQISDGVLDACLAQDPDSRVACECLVATNLVVLAGELTTKAKLHQAEFAQIVRDTITKIGYTDTKINFSAQDAKIQVHLHSQSPDIAQGVNAETAAEKEQGAGDQGMMFGYASDETPELMPAPILYSHRILEEFARIRKAQPDATRFLQPDAKSQVSILYEDGKPVRVTTIVVSHQHTEAVGQKELIPLVKEVVAKVIPANLRTGEIVYHVNPTGKFVIGGPDGDSGLTGRKIIVDTYGGVGCHGGGAFSGKDPSKVDRSAAYMCRYIAKNIVAAGLAHKAEVQVSYAIGLARPLSVCVDTFGTAAKGVSEEKIQEIVEKGGIFDLRPAKIIAKLGLKHPSAAGWSYQQTAAYGHFGRPQFPWEKTDQVAALRAAAGLKG